MSYVGCFCFLTALLVSSSGASDAGTRSRHVHPVRHRRVPGSNHLHEEFGRQPARQKEQEAAGFHLPNQKRGELADRISLLCKVVTVMCCDMKSVHSDRLNLYKKKEQLLIILTL